MDYRRNRIIEKVAVAVKSPSWWERQKGYNRAERIGDKGTNKLIADPKLIGERHIGALKGGLKGLEIGALIGGGAAGAAQLFKETRKDPGLALGLAAVGTLLGGLTGETIGAMKADKKYLKEKGIDYSLIPFKKSKFNSEAMKKYILPYRKTQEV